MFRFFIGILFALSLSLKGAVWTDCSEAFEVSFPTASETIAEAMDKPGATHEERQEIAQKARLIGDTVAFLSGRDVTSADSAGKISLENNFAGDYLVEIDGQRAIIKAVFSEEEAKPYLEMLDDAEKRTLEAIKDPIVNTIAVSAVGMGVPIVAKTLTVVGTAATAHYFGSIAADSGVTGLKQEAKDHPIRTFISIAPFIPGSKVLKVTQGTPGTLVKTEQAVQQELRLGQELKQLPQLSETVARETIATTTTAKVVSTETKAVQTEFGFAQELKQLPQLGENITESQIVKQRLQNVSQQAYDYAVDSVSGSGLKRTEVGLQAEQKATRWISQWLKREKITDVDFQVPGNVSRPDMIHYGSKTLFDFKLTPKAIRPKQKQGFSKDFPDYEVKYIFGPGEWRGK